MRVLRHFSGTDSGIKSNEYHLFRTQAEIKEFYVRHNFDIKVIPMPEISGNETCLFVFMPETFDGEIDGNKIVLIEEGDRVIFRVWPDEEQSSEPIQEFDTNVYENQQPVPESQPEKAVAEVKSKYIPPTPFAYFILPRINKKIVVQADLPPHGKMEHNWQTVKEFNPK